MDAGKAVCVQTVVKFPSKQEKLSCVNADHPASCNSNMPMICRPVLFIDCFRQEEQQQQQQQQ